MPADTSAWFSLISVTVWQGDDKDSPSDIPACNKIYEVPYIYSGWQQSWDWSNEVPCLIIQCWLHNQCPMSIVSTCIHLILQEMSGFFTSSTSCLHTWLTPAQSERLRSPGVQHCSCVSEICLYENISMQSSLKLAFPSFILMNKEWSFVWEKYKSDSTTQMGLIHWWLKYQINSLLFILAFYHFPDLTDITTFDILICLLWLKLRWALQFLFNKMISVNSLLWRTRKIINIYTWIMCLFWEQQYYNSFKLQIFSQSWQKCHDKVQAESILHQLSTIRQAWMDFFIDFRFSFKNSPKCVTLPGQ